MSDLSISIFAVIGSAPSSIPVADVGLSDSLLDQIADDIERESQVEDLGRVLGFNRAQINRYLATNRMEGRVTSRGTRDMLFDWRQKVSPCDHHVTFKMALRKAGLVYLADSYLKDIEIVEGNLN